MSRTEFPDPGAPRILRNTSFSVSTQVASVLAAILCMPILMRNLGEVRVGLLTIVWVLVGYFSVLDLGLGMAVTKSVSEALARGHRKDIPEIVWGAIRVQLAASAAVGVALCLVTPFVVSRFFVIQPSLAAEARGAFLLCACTVPILVPTSSIVGALQAAQRFDLIAKVQLPFGVAQYVALAILSYWRQGLLEAVATLLVLRLAGTVWLVVRLLHHIPEMRKLPRGARALQRGFLHFGGWLTVFNIVSPMMVYLDRALISSQLSVAALASYTVPLDAAMKISALPNSLSSVLYPAFSYHAVGAKDRAVFLLENSVRLLLTILVLPISAGIVFADTILGAWLGLDFAAKSAPLLRIILLGILANSLTRLPFAYVISAGRTRTAALILLIPAPLYVGMTIYLIGAYGLAGAAWAWSTRLVIEWVVYTTVAQSVAAKPLLESTLRSAVRPLTAMLLLVALGRAVETAHLEQITRWGLHAAMLVMTTLYLWKECLNTGDKTTILGVLRRRRGA